MLIPNVRLMITRSNTRCRRLRALIMSNFASGKALVPHRVYFGRHRIFNLEHVFIMRPVVINIRRHANRTRHGRLVLQWYALMVGIRQEDMTKLLILRSKRSVIVNVHDVVRLIQLIRTENVVSAITRRSIRCMLVLLHRVMERISVINGILILIIGPLLRAVCHLVFRRVYLICVHVYFFRIANERIVRRSPL